jgi:large subunit ribosomal protein L18
MIKMINRKRMHKVLHLRVRKKISGTQEVPRLCVFRSAKHIYAQIIDDISGRVILAESTLRKEVLEQVKNPGNIEAAKVVGQALAKLAAEKNIKKVVFDRGGYKFHGRVKALADSARANGLEF